jgi:hypothetical protein
MLSITDGGSLTRALTLPLDPRLQRLLLDRRAQLGGEIAGRAHFLLIQPGDTLASIIEATALPIASNPIDGSHYGDPYFTPAWEWIEDHGFCWEIVFLLDDSGFAHVLLIEQSEGMDPELSRLCEAVGELSP